MSILELNFASKPFTLPKSLSNAYRAGPRPVGAPGRLLISRPFKPTFFKNLFNVYLIGAGKVNFLLTFAFQSCKQSGVET
jgi:hypothetical protein